MGDDAEHRELDRPGQAQQRCHCRNPLPRGRPLYAWHRNPPRAAIRGVLAIGVSSVLVNAGVKSLSRRQRPDRAGAGVPGERHVRMPASASFPSGHAASAFAFTTAIRRERPRLALGLRFLAAAVAYSRVHTGVHYPGDTVAGALIGAASGQAVTGALDRRAGRPEPGWLSWRRVTGTT